jgi:dolichyl-phosphate beta-glucosyltransferase
MKRFIQFGLSAIVSVSILWVLRGYFDTEETLALVRGADRSSVLVGLLLMVLAYVLRGARWCIWETGLRYWDSLRLILIGFMGNNVLPARLGELLRAHCAAAKLGGDRRRTVALASITAERVLDGLVLSLLGLLSVALLDVDRRLEWALGIVSAAFAVLGLTLVIGIRAHQRLRATVTRVHRRFPGHLTRYASEKMEQFLDGLLPLGIAGRVASALIVTTLIWSIEVASYYLLGRAIWDGMSVSTALLMLVVVNFASLVPLTMGGIGSIEAAAPPFLIGAGAAPAAALAIVVLQHAGQYCFTTIAGAIVYIAGGFYRVPLTHRSAAAAAHDATGLNDSSLLSEARTSLGQSGIPLLPVARDRVQLSIVIPAFNEQARLPKTVMETIRWCTARTLGFEIIIVDDGSRDQTLALARLFEESDVRVRALACPHMGKGAAVRMGALNAKGEAILFMDADGATPLDEIPKLTAALADGHDVAIGSRVAQIEHEVVVRTSSLRRIVGRTFALLVNVLAIEGIADTQCGFKMFRRNAAEAVFPRQKLAGFAFDVEVLFIARRLRFSIAEIPVNWVAQPGSKVNLVTDSARMLWDVTQVRWLHRDLAWERAEQAAGAMT